MSFDVIFKLNCKSSKTNSHHISNTLVKFESSNISRFLFKRAFYNFTFSHRTRLILNMEKYTKTYSSGIFTMFWLINL